jgi:hypothetical protein
VKPSSEGPVLVLLEDHNSHLSIAAPYYYKEDGVTVLSFPSHCSHKLQLLYRNACGPVITYVNRACDTWIANHPGEKMSIHCVPSIMNRRLNSAAASADIKAGFLLTEFVLQQTLLS